MQTQSPISELRSISLYVNDAFGKIKSMMENGEISGHDAYAFIKAIEKGSDSIKSDVQRQAFSEYGEMTKGELDSLPHGLRATMIERKTYDFTSDVVWIRLKEQTIEREKLLKTATDQRVTVCDPDTGEIIPAVNKKTTTSFSLLQRKV